MLRRWNVDAIKGKVTGLTADQFEEGSNKSSSTLLFNSIMVHSLGVSERGFQKIIEDLDLLDLEDTNEELGNSTSEVISKFSNSEIVVRDPPLVASKRRPRTLRMKGSLEKLSKSKVLNSNFISFNSYLFAFSFPILQCKSKCLSHHV